jgi:hypothetical protein
MGFGFNPFTGQFDLTGNTIAPTGFKQLFSISDWTLSGNYYEITIPPGTHGKGLNPSIQVFELNGTDYEEVIIDTVIVDNNGNIKLKVPSTPDLRFNGKYIVK